MYDHVNPLPALKPDGIAPVLEPADIQAAFNQHGMPIPMIMISPWAKAHYVSLPPPGPTAMLKFIEVRFRVPALMAPDANSPDMTELFDFAEPPAYASAELTSTANHRHV